MRIDTQNNYKYTYPVNYTTFKNAAGDFGKIIGDVYQGKRSMSKETKTTILDKLRSALQDIMKPENYMGKGFYGTVYKINKDFVIKTENYKHYDPEDIKGTVSKRKELFKDLKTYYGEEILQIGKFKILRNLGKHIPAGVPQKKLQSMHSKEEANNYYQTEYLPLFAEVPQESYDAIAEDFECLNKIVSKDGESYSFDSVNPSNIVLCGDKLRLTDEINTGGIDANSCGKLLELMLFKLSAMSSVKTYGDNVKDAREIFKKIILASEKASLPHDTREKDITVWKEVLKNLDIETDSNTFIENLEIIRGQNPELSERIPKVKRYLDYEMNQSFHNVSFKGYSRDLASAIDMYTFKPELTGAEKNLIIKRIKNALKDILLPRRFIGEGTHNEVYRITPKYVARVPKGSKITEENIGDNLIRGQNLFKDLKNYYGEPLFTLGKFQILRNTGARTPAGIPEHLTKLLSKKQLTKYYLNRYLPRFAAIPQDGYNELAQNLAVLNSMKFGPRQYGLIDSLNPNNIVANKNKLLLVDEIYTLCDKSYANTTAKLLEMLINKASSNMDAPDAGNRIKCVRKIFKKIVLASINADLLQADSREDYKNWELALKKCKINMPAIQIINELEQISTMQCDAGQKIKLANQCIRRVFAQNTPNT